MKKIKFILNVLMIFFTLVVISPIHLYATTTVYNTVVTDELSNDESFNISDYPVNINDYSLDVITIAEGKNKELYIYVYRPSNSTTYHAKKISMSVEEQTGREAHSQQIYDLELVSSYSVFDKYQVLNYTVSDEKIRYYNIISIYRNFVAKVDSEIGGTVTNYKSYHVGKQFCLYYLNDKLVIEMSEFKTLDITVKLTDSIEFKDGITIGSLFGNFKKGYLHYIAFNLDDYIATHIYDADLSFKKRTVSKVISLITDPTYGEWENVNLTLYDTDVASFEGNGILGKTISWNRISKSMDFRNSMIDQGIEFSSDAIISLNSSQWVFAFYESELRTIGLTSTAPIKTYEEIQDIAILRIYFKDITGKSYDLGIVGDITSDDGVPGGTYDPYENILNEFGDTITLILGLLLIVILFTVGLPVVKVILDVLLFIISVPFKLIKFIFFRNKKGR